ncbi:hypothetical protein TrVFT333_008553 [Trichoderma virens FT-333]|nr:hypothetical protein TrVFT333_008553 [Trichoderma virens FT-333]
MHIQETADLPTSFFRYQMRVSSLLESQRQTESAHHTVSRISHHHDQASIELSPVALSTVRGFQITPVASGDEDSDNGIDTPRLSAQRGRPRIDDVVSANCSPVLRGTASPRISGIAKLRLQMDPLSLDAASRSSSMSRNGSRLNSHTSLGQMSRSQSRDGNRSETGSELSDGGSTSYEVNLENDFVSESVRERSFMGTLEGGLNPRRKMTSEDFEPLRCLGKGTYGTVILVKQRATGRLYAQKQFKKASLVVHKKLVEQTKTERQILESVNRHPFVVKLFYAFQDQEKLYLILEYGQGENCLLILTRRRYFGLSKVAIDQSEDSCNSILGTVEYMAPEVILGKKYGKAVDWWSFGALAYDLMTGNPPFRGGNHAKIQDNIVKQKLVLPYYLSLDAKDLLTRLLRKDPNKRLGAVMPKDMQTMKNHRFFRKIDWKKLAAREMEPPIQPMITDPELAENFAPEFTELSLSPTVSSREFWPASPSKDDMFGGFSFVASSSLLESGGYLMSR